MKFFTLCIALLFSFSCLGQDSLARLDSIVPDDALETDSAFLLSDSSLVALGSANRNDSTDAALVVIKFDYEFDWKLDGSIYTAPLDTGIYNRGEICPGWLPYKHDSTAEEKWIALMKRMGMLAIHHDTAQFSIDIPSAFGYAKTTPFSQQLPDPHASKDGFNLLHFLIALAFGGSLIFFGLRVYRRTLHLSES